ncbi:MAG TPA: SRPBCC family protein [Qipengyuania sp.]|nr:SRPBCC family protein [Qipengyuania sp.]
MSDSHLYDDAPVAASKDAKPDRSLLEEAVTIRKPASELYAFWKNPENLVGVLENVVSIEKLDESRSRWTVKAPAGREVSWEAVITKDEPGRALYWQSAEGADIDNSGRVLFEEAGERGTIVRATIAYDPPAGVIGQTIAKLFQREPRIQARRDLHRFKQLMETGEIATSARNRREREERGEEQLATTGIPKAEYAA